MKDNLQPGKNYPYTPYPTKYFHLDYEENSQNPIFKNQTIQLENEPQDGHRHSTEDAAQRAGKHRKVFGNVSPRKEGNQTTGACH